MFRISEITLDQLNRRFDTLEILQNQVLDLHSKLNNIGQSANIADAIHAPQTTNNVAFTWTGATGVLSWTQGYIKDKNWNAQTVARPTIKSSAKGQQHFYAVPAGSLTLSPSTYYWLGWDAPHQSMLATQDASQLHSN